MWCPKMIRDFEKSFVTRTFVASSRRKNALYNVAVQEILIGLEKQISESHFFSKYGITSAAWKVVLKT